jgi:hypothetical protein
LYDPHYTPAAVLEKMLNAYQPEREFEVIDLAKTNLRAIDLKEVSRQCLLLEPDAIVVFAGNNWKFGFSRFGDEERALVGEDILKPERFSKMLGILEQNVTRDAVDMLDWLGSIAREHNIPVQFIIPEFNLIDWRSTKLERIVSQFDGGQTRDWVLAREAAQEALATQDWERVEQYADDMIRLDPSNPLGYELKADCKLRLSLFDQAREYLEMAKDYATLFQRADSKPRILSKTRQTLLEHAASRGISVVDLREIFGQYLGGKLPDRRLFIDYCHLTVEGIQLAMQESATDLLTTLALPVDRGRLDVKDVTPANEVISLACFYAALHNIHCGQPVELARYYAANALKHSPKAIQFLLLYTDMASRRAPTYLCDAFIKLPEVYMDLTKPKGNEVMDIEVVDCMLDLLEANKIKLRQRIKLLRQQEFGYQNRPIDLTEAPYRTTSFQSLIGRVTRCYYRSYERVSEFIFPSVPSDDITVELVYRVPAYNHYDDEQMVLELNGRTVCELPPTPAWNKVAIRITKDLLVDGISCLKVYWPLYTSRGEAFRSTPRSLFNLLYENFGEVFSFRITPVCLVENEEEAHFYAAPADHLVPVRA